MKGYSVKGGTSYVKSGKKFVYYSTIVIVVVMVCFASNAWTMFVHKEIIKDGYFLCGKYRFDITNRISKTEPKRKIQYI